MAADLLIAAATRLEVAPFLSRLSRTAIRQGRGGTTLFSGEFNKKACEVLLTGPGMLNAACALAGYLETRQPAMILHTGIGGVFKDSGLCVRDVVIATLEDHRHCGIQADDGPNAPLPFDLVQECASTRQGIYLMPEHLVRQCKKHLSRHFSQNGTKIAAGKIMTSDTLCGSLDQAYALYRQHQPLMEAMEGAAIAHAAMLCNTPLLEIRAASNIVGERDKRKWDIPGAADQVEQICLCILKHLDDILSVDNRDQKHCGT